MKVSYNWLQSLFSETLPSPESLAETLTNLGLEVEKITQTGLTRNYLDQFIVVQIREVLPHPNADRLRLAKVWDGQQELSIVCGAPNLCSGQLSILAPVNSLLKTWQGESIKIKKGKIRGEFSYGMLCSESELGLSNNFEEIIALEPHLSSPGCLASSVYTSTSDSVLELAITPNRGDALSYLGLAYELRAALGFSFSEFPVLDYKKVALKQELPLKITLEDVQACARYAAMHITNVTIAESPTDLKAKLACSGISSVNNLVDVANIVMQELGQPIHAFDVDLLVGRELNVRFALQGEKICTLDGKERDLDDSVLVIADAKSPACIAGVIGAKDYAINNSTKNISLEFAHFNPKIIRKAAKKFAISTDAAFRFERYVDPNRIPLAINRTLFLLKQYGVIGPESAVVVKDIYPKPILPKKINVEFKYINERAGFDIPAQTVRGILDRLGFEIVDENTLSCHVAVPTAKADITSPIDILEEVLRVYGYDRIPTENSLRYCLHTDEVAEFKSRLQVTLSNFLTARGYFEVMNNSLTKLREPIKLGDASARFNILNPLSQDLAVMRDSLLPGILENISHNKRRQRHDLKFYEFGNVYGDFEDSLSSHRLGIALTGTYNEVNWFKEPVRESTFFTIKGIVEAIFKRLGLTGLTGETRHLEAAEPALAYIAPDGVVLARIQQVDAQIRKEFQINSDVFYAEIDFGRMVELCYELPKYEPKLSNFPGIRRDLSVLVPREVHYGTLRRIAHDLCPVLLKNIALVDVYSGSKIPASSLSYSISYFFQSPECTLTDAQVEHLMQKILREYGQVGVHLRTA